MAITIAGHRILSQRCLLMLRYQILIFATISLLSYLPVANAQEVDNPPGKICLSPNDMINSTTLLNFDINSWSRRGDCVRRGGSAQCFSNLGVTLSNLNSLRSSEYSAAAGVLSLLPTIGALLGSPSHEIWKLMTVLPLGGGLAIAVSFGGAILPVKVEDYEDVVDKKSTAIGSIAPLATKLVPGQGSILSLETKLSLLTEKIRGRLDRRESARLSRRYLWLSLGAMVILLAGAQGAMGAIELGGVVVFWCEWTWWMHFWYLLVTSTAVLENWAQIPFITSHKLYVSSVPYEVSISGGEVIDNVAVDLRQLKTLRMARLGFHGTNVFTRSRNSVMIMISVVGDTKLRQIFRLLTKSMSIAVFVIGTAIFASVTLLSLKMAVMVLTLNLVAGVFGRAIAGWVVSIVSDVEPMIHVIANSHEEAYRIINEVLSINSKSETLFQTEIHGHVFIDGRCVARRSSLWITVLGVIAEPYDLRKTPGLFSPLNSMESPFLGSDFTPASSRVLEKSAMVQSRSERSRMPDIESLTEDDGRIVRKPIGSYALASSHS